MIRDLSATLQAVLTQTGLPAELGAANIIFDRPDEATFPTEQRTVVDLFLYDIRQNVDLRSIEPEIIRNNGQITTRAPALRVACSYLVTAGPAAGTDLALQEQRLLSQVLQVLSGLPTIPPTFLQGSLVGQQPPLPLVTALVEPDDNLAEVWTALGVKLRPSLTVKVTISMPVAADISGPPVTTKITGFGFRTSAVEERWVQIGGRVLTADGQGIPGALLGLVDAGLQTTSDAEGRYSFLRVAVGSHSLRVVVVGFQPKTESLVVPSKTEDYDVILTPL